MVFFDSTFYLVLFGRFYFSAEIFHLGLFLLSVFSLLPDLRSFGPVFVVSLLLLLNIPDNFLIG